MQSTPQAGAIPALETGLPAIDAGLSPAEHQAIRAIVDTCPYVPDRHPTQRWFTPGGTSLGLSTGRDSCRVSVYRCAGDQVAELALKGPLFNVWAMLTPDELRTVAGMCLAAARDIECQHEAPRALAA